MYFIIALLIIVYFISSWKSTKDFENIATRISYVAIGTIFVTILTLILFGISRIGIEYPKQEMIGEVRKIILLAFVPINGFVILTQFSSIAANIKSGILSKDELNRRIKILSIICIALIVLECFYLKNIQNGLIQIINSKK